MGERTAMRFAVTTGTVALLAAAGLVPMFAEDAGAEEISTGFFLYLAPGSGSLGKLRAEAPNQSAEQTVSKSAQATSGTHNWRMAAFGDGFELDGPPTASIYVNLGTSVGSVSMRVSLTIGGNETEEVTVPLSGTGNKIVNVTLNFTDGEPGPITNQSVQLTTVLSGVVTSHRYRVNSTATPSHVFLPGATGGGGDDDGDGDGNETGNETGDNETGDNETGENETDDNETEDDEAEECPPEGQQGDPADDNETSGNDTDNGTDNGTGGNETDEDDCPPADDGGGNETGNGTGNQTGNGTGNDTGGQGGNRTGRGRFPLSDLDDEGEFLAGDDEDEEDGGRKKKKDGGVPGFTAALPVIAALAAMSLVALRRRRAS